MNTAAEPDPLPVYVRAFAFAPKSEKERKPPINSEDLDHLPSEWSLVFDCETTIDPPQRLRFGAYQIYKGQRLVEHGFFYAEDMPASDLQCLREVTEQHNKAAGQRRPRLLTVSQFRQWVFREIGYKRRANIIGINLPFDLARLATKHAPARGETVRGGFSFDMSNGTGWPRLQVKHLSRRAALMQFAQRPRRRDSNSREKRGLKTPIRRGFFVDVKTTAAALLNELHSLESLCGVLQTKTRKKGVGTHGEALTAEYVAYCRDDVQATWECFEKLSALFAEYGLSEVPLSRLYSEASVSKAYLRAMGIKPLLQVQSEIPPTLLGQILSAYFGGRAEVRLRRTMRQVLYYDFLSMYPTVSILQGLWSFVIGQGVQWDDATEHTRNLLERVTLEDLQNPNTWKQLAVLVELSPDCDLFPVRTKYPRGPDAFESNATIGLNYLTCQARLWYTLADCVTAKLLTGKAPQITRALAFRPGPPQKGLKPIIIAGRSFDPYDQDLLKSLIEERQAVKIASADLTGEAKAKAKRDQQALKIIANTIYGISVELNVSTDEKKQTIIFHGPVGVPFMVRSAKAEKPGPYFNPLVGTLITGAARLMLGLAERLIADAGLEWCFCDTDSMAIAKPEGMADEEFQRRAARIQQWFEALNPYGIGGSILKREHQNEPIAASQDSPTPLYCFAISAKRYALFNVDEQGCPVIRKASAHGLGHLEPPYDESDAPSEIPPPSVPLAEEIGVRRWHYDLWYKILEAALAGRPNQVDRSFHPSLNGPAFSRYAATSPHQLRAFDRYNASRQNPAEHVWPFSFMYVLQAKSASSPSTAWPPKRGRKPAPKKISPIAPFGRDFEACLREAFDRDTGEPVARDELKSYAEALADYHLRPESKFLNARAFDRGRTERRHIIASGIVHIGKEADQLEDRVIQDMNDEAEVIYGANGSSGEHLRALLCEAVKVSSVNAVAAATGISRGHLTRVVRGAPLKTAVNTHKIILALSVGSIRPRPKAWRTTPDNPSSPRSATANTQPLHTKL